MALIAKLLKSKKEKTYIKPTDWAESHGVKVDVVMKAFRDAGVVVRTHMSKVEAADYEKIEDAVKAEKIKIEARRLKPIEEKTYIKPTDWAKSHGVKVDFVMKVLRDVGISVRTHMSLVEEKDYTKVEEIIEAEKIKNEQRSNSFKPMATLKLAPTKTPGVIQPIKKAPLKAQVFYPDERILARIRMSQEVERLRRNSTGNIKASLKNELPHPIKHNPEITFQEFKKNLLKTIESSHAELDAIQLFAHFDNYDNQISKLADLALDEEWNFKKNTRSKSTHPILRNYLNQSFTRILFEDCSNSSNEEKLKLSEDGKYCIFNTGLADKSYEPIYVLFTKDETTDEWGLDCFTCSSNKQDKKACKQFSNSLPKPAKFYKDLSDLVFDSESDIPITFNSHIVIENCSRLPIQLIKKHATGFNFDNYSGTQEQIVELTNYLEGNSRVCHKIFGEIKNEIEQSIKEVKWNFKRAIPIYYPKFKEITLLLPLNLADDEYLSNGKPHADVALAISKENGYYEIRTILTMEMAYMDARLIVKPEENWLSLDNIKHTTTNC